MCGVTGRMAVEANMGAISAIMRYGTEGQKRLAAGLALVGDKPAICITEPSAGSAATEMKTSAVGCGDAYVLNGKKHWITGGGVSKLHLVFARVFDEDGVEQGIGGFIVVRDGGPSAARAGFQMGEREPAMGLRGIPETEVILENVQVESKMVLWPPGGFRHGVAELMSAYNSQRVGAATVALAIARGVFDESLAFTKCRKQFGRPIAGFQGLQWMLADISIALNAARLAIYDAACSADWPDSSSARIKRRGQRQLLGGINGRCRDERGGANSRVSVRVSVGGVEHRPYKEKGAAPFRAISRRALFEAAALDCELRYF